MKELEVAIATMRDLIASQLACAEEVNNGLKLKQSKVDHSIEELGKLESELKRLSLTEEEREKLRNFDPNSSNSSLIEPIQRLLDLKRARAVLEDDEILDILNSANEKLSVWFERNISTIQLDSVNPSISTLVGYIIEMQGQQYIKVYSKRK